MKNHQDPLLNTLEYSKELCDEVEIFVDTLSLNMQNTRECLAMIKVKADKLKNAQTDIIEILDQNNPTLKPKHTAW